MSNDCGSFWFWFVRPAAEILGVLSLVLAIGLVLFIIYIVFAWLEGERNDKPV